MDKTDRRSLNATVPPAATSARSASNTWAGMPTGVLLCAADGESSDSQRGFAKDDYRADLKIACDGFEVVENKFGLLEGAAPGRAPNKQKRQAGRPTAGEQHVPGRVIAEQASAPWEDLPPGCIWRLPTNREVSVGLYSVRLRPAGPCVPDDSSVMQGDCGLDDRMATHGTMPSVTSEQPDSMGRYALGYAAAQEPVDRQGSTALHFACQNREDIVVALLAAGAPVNARDAWGNTPLSRGVHNANGAPGNIHRLVAAGADPDIKNTSGSSPRSLAEFDSQRRYLDLLPAR
jgi:hypothetical protein